MIMVAFWQTSALAIWTCAASWVITNIQWVSRQTSTTAEPRPIPYSSGNVQKRANRLYEAIKVSRHRWDAASAQFH